MAIQETGSSMGVLTGDDARRTSQRIAERQTFLIEDALFTHRHELVGALQKVGDGEPLSLLEAGLVAETNSIVAFLHAKQFVDDLIFEDDRGQKHNGSTCINRLKDFYRMAEFLRLSGILREDIFEGNKLFLGTSTIVSDVYPFAYAFSFTDSEALEKLESYVQETDQPSMNFPTLLKEGVVKMSKRTGKIRCVENNQVHLLNGLKWSKLMGIEVEGFVGEAREYLATHKNELVDANISLVAAIRSDPMLLGPVKDQNDYQRRLHGLTEPIAKILKSSNQKNISNERKHGQFLASVGSGRPPRDRYVENYRQYPEYGERQKLLKSIRAAFTGSCLQNSIYQDLMKVSVTAPWLIPEMSDLEVLVMNTGTTMIRP